LKLTKTSWVLLAIGVFVITFASLGVFRFQQVRQQNQLDEEFALAQLNLKQVRLEQLSSRQAELEKQLSQATLQFEAVKAILSRPIGSITISDILFDIAEVNSVEVTKISSSGLASEELEGVPCLALRLTTRVEGELPDLVSFITMLNGDLATGVVKSVEISIPETTSEGKPSANIQLVIYTYEGD